MYISSARWRFGEEEINHRFRKSALDFLLVIRYNYWSILCNYKVTQHFGRFRFGWDFSTDTVFGDFEPLKVKLNISDTQKARPYITPRLLSHHTSKCIADSVGELTKQE